MTKKGLAPIVFLALAYLLTTCPGPHVRRLDLEKAELAKLQMEHLGSALWLFWLDVGRYPTSEEGLQALILSPGIPGWAGPYLNAIEIPRDPWGCHYKYDSYGTAYQLLTYGADGKKGGDGEAADIISERPSHRR